MMVDWGRPVRIRRLTTTPVFRFLHPDPQFHYGSDPWQNSCTRSDTVGGRQAVVREHRPEKLMVAWKM